MRLTELLFSFKGRIGRQYWWLTSLAVAVIAGMASSLVELAAKVTGNGAINPDSNEFEPSAPFFAIILAMGSPMPGSTMRSARSGCTIATGLLGGCLHRRSP